MYRSWYILHCETTISNNIRYNRCERWFWYSVCYRKNIEDSTAENITMMISVKGGILGRINMTKICSGCGNCSNSIEPNAIKTESTAEAGKIVGFGPVTIMVSAEASNAERVNKSLNGFALRFLVIVTK